MDDSSFIVGDAGGTSTQWRIVENGKISQFETIGFNAYTHKIEDLLHGIINQLPRSVSNLKTYFYAAGVDTPEQKLKVEKELGSVFNSIKVENDLLAVARSLCGNEAGNACILGTGSNACFYDGSQVNKVSASLGYILGDEGSGAHLGKKLLKRIFREQIGKDIIDQFDSRYNLSSHNTIEQIYYQPKPNHFLASFAPFLYENRNHPEIYQLIHDSFCEFYHAYFSNSDYKDQSFQFSGSIAYYFSDILRQVGNDQQIRIQNIVQSPIAGLVLYHKKNG